jgi:phosphatidate phosphatase PAH1
MLLMAVSTPRRPPKEIKNSISYETRGEYFLIKIKTRMNPNNYGKFDPRFINSGFELSFDDREEGQIFKIDESGELITKIYIFNENKDWILLEQIILNEEDCSTFTEDGYFIIRIKNELIKYENPRLSDIYLCSNDGKYIHEVYLE